MPDMKYSDADTARKYSKIRNYPQVNQTAVKEMHRQVGDLQIDEKGVAQRGLLVRHLVLPDGIAGTEETIRFLRDEISVNTYLNLMNQYRPSYKAHLYPELNRRLTNQEYQSAVEAAMSAGLHRLDQRKSKFWFIN
jgi:putative pyruvate formate lyase activating enzyme